MLGETFVSKEQLKEITEHLTLTNHAKDRIAERLGKDITEEQIKTLIINSSLAWNNEDKTIGVKINKDNFFVISEKKADGRYILITVKEKSLNNKTIEHKVFLSLIGKHISIERTYKEGGTYGQTKKEKRRTKK